MPDGRAHFQDEMGHLERQAMGALDMCAEALERTMEALDHRDVELAQHVVLDDDRIDGRYLEVHQGVLSLLALQAPVAGDLRVIAALLHIIRCAERMGDQCVNVCKLFPIAGHDAPEHDGLTENVQRMGTLARSQILQARQCFERRDVGLAEDLARQDDAIDALNRECFQIALDIGDDKDTREWGMSMLLIARALERIGDNAVDIGEQTAFVVTGLFREFQDASHVA